MQRPTYSTTKRAIWLNCFMAWLVIVLLAFGAVWGSDQAVAFANIALPSMVLLIGGTLGIHRHYGSKDFAASHERGEPLPPYQARDQPGGGA
jgi:hypothetical protein